MTFDINSLSKFPTKCGVYIMKDINDKILYIGKAKNLRNRLKQYFFLKDLRASVPFLVAQISSIETIIVSNNKEALILENNLIKKHHPKYNILLKDDKTYVSIMINTSHKWPMIKLVRLKSTPNDNNHYFGPYTNAYAARSIKDLLLKLFPLRQCSDLELANRTRPCILYDIRKCIAPCVDKCTKEEYDLMVHKILLFLKGKDSTIINELKNKMQKASDALEFEKANEYLNLINQIKELLVEQFVDILSQKNCDVIGLYRDGFNSIIVKLIFQKGRLTSSEHFSFFEIASTDEEIIESFILQHYQTNSTPKEVLIPLELDDLDNLKELLANQSIKISCPQKGKKTDLINLANENAKSILIQEKDQKCAKEKQLLELQKTFNLTNYPSHIICFDVSNISQTSNVAAMTTFINGEKDKSKMKLFKISTASQGDVPSLKEALYRHFSKITNLPDLLIVDGAKAQLNAALEIFENLNIASVDILAISKEMAKHTKSLTHEKVFVPYKKDPIVIDSASPILFILQKIRDEAHRIAISFHKKTRSKKIISTKLVQIPKIGPKKTKELLKVFKSIENLKNAKEEDLEKLKILSSSDIKNILEFLNKNK
ncbi:MAG: excinuclease ABC subunit UvrC [Parachlamydiales bacterium]|jgi:excinuclease ABC subunit C